MRARPGPASSGATVAAVATTRMPLPGADPAGDAVQDDRVVVHGGHVDRAALIPASPGASRPRGSPAGLSTSSAARQPELPVTGGKAGARAAGGSWSKVRYSSTRSAGQGLTSEKGQGQRGRAWTADRR